MCIRDSNISRSDDNSLLSRMEAFLPQMKAANQKVEEELASGAPPSKFDIEAVEEDQEHIQMALHLGVGEEQVEQVAQPKIQSLDKSSDSETEDSAMAEDVAADL
eukprot:TRINITY_DN36302_c0_g1_i2.p2 TRINITY_DN36302_c0_g1~~TRINITY_DN36302_c0_g1_i2.p2  ORF type:complete len:105 (-),score=52.28 TRINITY_DN36302_c0_g1_i2:406-720(-)